MISRTMVFISVLKSVFKFGIIFFCIILPACNGVKPQTPVNPVKEVKTPEPLKKTALEIGRDGNFIIYDNDTVLDNTTGLMWAAQDNERDINWFEAKIYCEKFRGGGYSDWRLPSLDELKTLYNPAKTYPVKCYMDWKVHLTPLIQLSCACPWSTDTKDTKTALKTKKEAACFGFNGGRSLYSLQGSHLANRALPVRDTGIK